MKKILEKYNLTFDSVDIKAWLLSYIFINLTFLYNTLNFLWGNHDAKFIKDGLQITSGLFEGRFTQFIPHTLLTSGQILPILNNLIGFAFLTLGLWLLAKYWQIPKSVLNYTLFITFFATMPYTLSWIYFTFITISCLLWVLLAVMGLYLAAQIPQNSHKLTIFIVSVICFYLPLGGYPPIINTICVCFTAKIFFMYLFENKSLKEIYQHNKFTILTLIIAAILFKTTLKLITPNNVYNLETITLNDIPQKLLAVIKISAQQFIITLPFMELNYKLILLILMIVSFIAALLKAKTPLKTLMTMGGFFAVILAAATTTFLVVPHTEYVARIDFYGLAFIYLFALAILLKCTLPLAKSISLILMLILIPLNITNDYRAQKIWQQGFDAEFQILDRIIERIENHPNFNPDKSYHFRQLGDISMRPKYYKQTFTQNEPFLLALPYLAMWQGENLIEFYSPYNYINHATPLTPADITPELYKFITEQARPWPHPQSIYINDTTILVILAQNELDDFRKMIEKLY